MYKYIDIIYYYYIIKLHIIMAHVAPVAAPFYDKGSPEYCEVLQRINRNGEFVFEDVLNIFNTICREDFDGDISQTIFAILHDLTRY